MANGIFDFELPDKRIIRVEGAPSEEAARAFMDTQWDRLRREMPIEGFGESFGQQFRGQFGSVPGALQAGAAAVGAPESITAGLGAAREFVAPGDQNRGTRAPEPGDLLRNPIDALSAYAGQAAGAVLGGAAAPLLGAGAGLVVGGPGGAATGATAGLFGGSVLGSVDELYQGLIAEGIPPQQAGIIATTFGTAIGVGEAAALGPVIKRIMGNQVSDAVVDRIASRLVGGRAGGVRQTAALGAGGEMLGETARQGVIATATGDLDLAERAERVLESGIVGGIAGGGVGAGVRAAGRAGPAPGATPSSAEQEAAALETLRQGTLPGEAPIEGAQQPAPAPTPAEAGPPRPAPLPIPDRPEPFTTREEAEAFIATSNFAPPVPLTTSSAIIGFANNARIADWEATTQQTRRQAINEFFPRAPGTTQIAAPESFSNLAEAANRGELKLTSFTPNAVARAALASRDIDPDTVTPDQVRAASLQLDALAEAGVIQRNVTETTSTVKGKKVKRRKTSYAVNFGTPATAQPASTAAPAPAAAPAIGAVPPTTQGAPVPEAAPAPPAPQATAGFKTALGSTYAINDQGQTIRTKQSPGRGQGKTYAPHNALFVTPDEANNVLEELRGGNTYRFIVNDPAGPRRTEPGESLQGKQVALGIFRPDGSVVRYVPAQMRPAVGLSPVELRVEGTGADRKSFRHIGNPITELAGAPAARTTVEVGGVQRETTPETVQQTVNDIRAARPAAAPPPPPTPPGPPPQMTDAEKKQINDPINEPIIGSVMNFFASPILTITKLSRNFAPVRNAFMKFTNTESFYKDKAAAAHRSLHDLSDESARKVGLGLDRSRRTRQEVNEADYTPEEMKAIRDFRAHMNFIYDAAIDGVARKYFNPDLAKDPATRARLQAFQDQYTGQFLSNIPDAALDAASPEGAALVRKYKAARDPFYFPQRTEGTHFVAAREVGKKDPVALYAYTPLNALQKRRGFEDPEAAAIRKLREEFPNSSTHTVMTSGMRFEYDERAKSLKDNADFINRYLDRLRDVSGKEGKRVLDQMGAEIDKATMDSLFKPYKGILRAITPENAVEYVRNYLPAYYLTAGRLNARLLTKPDFDLALKPLRPENRDRFQGILDYATSPSEAYSTARAFTFFQYLGGALDTAAVSALQIPTAVAPRFGRDAGVAKGTAYFTKALNEALFDKAIFSVLKSDQAYAKTIAGKPGRSDEVQVLKRAIQRGVLRPSSAFQMQGAVSPGDLRSAGIADKDAVKFANGINKVVDLAGRPLAAVEEYGRTATFMAAYRLARDNPSVIEAANRYDNTNYKTPEDYAQGVVFDTWYAGSKMDDPGFIRDYPILNLATQFMRPVFKFTETVLRDATKTLKGMAATDLTMARMGAISVFGSLGPLVLLGGLWALPFADLSRELLERLLKTVFDNPLDLRLELDRAMGGERLGEAANFGLPSAFNIANLSKRIAVDPIPSDTLFDWSTLALIGPAGDILQRIPKTYEHWKRGEYWEAAASFPLTPRVIGNAIKGAQLAVDQEQFTQSGTRLITPELVERVDTRSAVPASVRQALGFPAPELANERELWRRAQVIDKATDDVNKSITMELSRIFLRALEAQRSGDMAEHARQVQRLQTRRAEIAAEQAAKPQHLRGNINMTAVRDRARQDLLGRSAPEVLIGETRRQARPALPPIIEEMRWRDRQ